MGEPAKPARCDTPVPQPLSVVNSVKAWKCQKVGERASGGHIVLFLAPPLFFVSYFTMMVSLGLGFILAGRA